MLVRSNNKWDAVHALINTLLKDKTLYCNNCGTDYDPNFPECCEEPHIGNHATFLKLIVEQNKFIKQSRHNEFASTPSKSMRMKFSLPPRFFHELCQGWQDTYGDKLFENEHDHNQFTRKFRQFAVCERV